MKTDRELLELAAKAAGVNICEWLDGLGFSVRIRDFDKNNPMRAQFSEWNPLTDDGDALRLAVKLKFRIETDVMLCGTNGLHPSGIALIDYGDGDEVEEPHNGNDFSATRRAITRAAAAIGESMP